VVRHQTRARGGPTQVLRAGGVRRLAHGATLVDTAVRTAWDLPHADLPAEVLAKCQPAADGKRYAFAIEDLPDLCATYAEAFPGGGGQTMPVPYKINVYAPGGFFKPHVDSPTLSPTRMLGTVVQRLESTFTGGELVVRGLRGGYRDADMAAREAVVDFTQRNAGWCAMYGDLPHEVRPVTSGHRVTLTLQVLATEELPAPAKASGAEPDTGGGTAVSAPPPACAHTALLRKLLADRPAAAQDGFGFLLYHNYTIAAAEAGHLKGVDAALRRMLEAEGFVTVVHPAVYSAYVNRGPPDSDGNYDVSCLSRGHHVFRLNSADITHGCWEGMPKKVPFVRPIKKLSSETEISFHGRTISHDETDGVEWTGNEGIDDMVSCKYATAVLIATPREGPHSSL